MASLLAKPERDILMFILLLQIGLTFWVLRKGWKKWAFAPPVAAFVLGLLVSGILSAIGIESGYISWLSFLLDLGSIVVLIGMIRRPLNQKQLPAQTQAPLVTAASTQAVEGAEQVTIH